MISRRTNFFFFVILRETNYHKPIKLEFLPTGRQWSVDRQILVARTFSSRSRCTRDRLDEVIRRRRLESVAHASESQDLFAIRREKKRRMRRFRGRSGETNRGIPRFRENFHRRRATVLFTSLASFSAMEGSCLRGTKREGTKREWLVHR